jgi:hypothetical protein
LAPSPVTDGRFRDVKELRDLADRHNVAGCESRLWVWAPLRLQRRTRLSESCPAKPGGALGVRRLVVGDAHGRRLADRCY